MSQVLTEGMAGSGRLDMVCKCGDKLYVPATAQLRQPGRAASDADGGAAAGAGGPRYARNLFQYEAEVPVDHKHCIVLAFLRSCPNPGYAGFLRSQSQMTHPMGRKVYKVCVCVCVCVCAHT